MFYEIAKRVLDIVVSLTAIVVFSPVLIAFAIAVKLDGTRGPVFNETNTRVGRYKKPFFMYKFRSMPVGSHVDFWKNHPELKDLEEEWKRIGKLPIDRDPRITKVGRIIRKTDLDELPQLFNVLKGEMSVVGPRAPYLEELERYIERTPEIKENVDKAYSVRPGITGIWQISGRNAIPIPQRYEMEAGYAMRRNVFEDIKIIIMTPIVMLTRKGVAE